MATRKSAAKFYVVFNNTRCIFFGEKVSYDKVNKTMVLKNARRVHYYAKEKDGTGGPDQLAAFGPQAGSKIGPVVSETTVTCVDNFVLVSSPDALQRWEKSSWE